MAFDGKMAVLYAGQNRGRSRKAKRGTGGEEINMTLEVRERVVLDS